MVRSRPFRRPLTRIARLRNRYNALNRRVIVNQTPIGWEAAHQQYLRRQNALRLTAGGMIRRFIRNPGAQRLGSRYR